MSDTHSEVDLTLEVAAAEAFAELHRPRTPLQDFVGKYAPESPDFEENSSALIGVQLTFLLAEADERQLATNLWVAADAEPLEEVLDEFDWRYRSVRNIGKPVSGVLVDSSNSQEATALMSRSPLELPRSVGLRSVVAFVLYQSHDQETYQHGLVIPMATFKGVTARFRRFLHRLNAESNDETRTAITRLLDDPLMERLGYYAAARYLPPSEEVETDLCSLREEQEPKRADSTTGLNQRRILRLQGGVHENS